MGKNGSPESKGQVKGRLACFATDRFSGTGLGTWGFLSHSSPGFRESLRLSQSRFTHHTHKHGCMVQELRHEDNARLPPVAHTCEVPCLATEPKLLPKGLWENFGLKTGTVVSPGNV